jgi:hypothetical protein
MVNNNIELMSVVNNLITHGDYSDAKYLMEKNSKHIHVTTTGETNRYTSIEDFIVNDPELLRLYETDNCFRAVIKVAIADNMPIQDALVYAIKVGYTMKNELSEIHMHHMEKCTSNILRGSINGN